MVHAPVDADGKVALLHDTVDDDAAVRISEGRHVLRKVLADIIASFLKHS